MPDPTPVHSCDNCDGVDPGSCLANPARPAPVPPPADVRELVAAAIARHDYEIGLGSTTDVREHHRGQADAVLRVPAIAEALTAAAAVGELRTALAMQTGVSADLRVESKARGDKLDRVRAECDRIEAAVRANPHDPDFDGAYLAAIGHIRRAVIPTCPTCGPFDTEPHPRLPVTRCANCKEHLAALDPQEQQ